MIKTLFYDKHSDAIRYNVYFNENMEVVKAIEELITNTGDVKKVIFSTSEYENIKDEMNPIWIDRIKDAITENKKSLTLNTVQLIKWNDNIEEAKKSYNQLINENIKDIKTSYNLHLLKLIQYNIEKNKYYDDNIKTLLNKRIEIIENCINNNTISELVC